MAASVLYPGKNNFIEKEKAYWGFCVKSATEVFSSHCHPSFREALHALESDSTFHWRNKDTGSPFFVFVHLLTWIFFLVSANRDLSILVPWIVSSCFTFHTNRCYIFQQNRTRAEITVNVTFCFRTEISCNLIRRSPILSFHSQNLFCCISYSFWADNRKGWDGRVQKEKPPFRDLFSLVDMIWAML